MAASKVVVCVTVLVPVASGPDIVGAGLLVAVRVELTVVPPVDDPLKPLITPLATPLLISV